MNCDYLCILFSLSFRLLNYTVITSNDLPSWLKVDIFLLVYVERRVSRALKSDFLN